MRKIVYLLAALVVFAGAVFAYMHFFMGPPPDLDLAREKSTRNALYTVAIAPEDGTVRQGPMHNWIVTVTSPQGEPVDGARLAIDGGMPQHGHGLPTSPAVTAELGHGRYRVEGVRFNMAGWWEFAVTVSAPPGEDRAVFNLTL